MKRSLGFLGALALAAAAPAQAADTVSLAASSKLLRFGAPVTLGGAVTPAVPDDPVTILAGAIPVWSGVTEVDGSFGTTLAAQRAAGYVAVAGVARSLPVSIRMRPMLRAGVRGARVVGSRLRVSGRVLPHQAGRLTVRAGRSYRARIDRSGRFRATVPARGPGQVRLRVVLRPARGNLPTSRRLTLHLKAPNLSFGARGEAVFDLERRLAALGYALVGVDRLYAGDTRDAVLAFQVIGLPRTGGVDSSVWRALRAARRPAPRVRGSHVEVYPSVPAYPASHGCVRMPMWFAAGFHARWPYGATVRIFP